MPSILNKNDKVTFIARKNFTLNGEEHRCGEDVPEMNDHPKLEVFVRNGYVIPIVEDKKDTPFQFRRTVMTRELAMHKLRLGNPKGATGLQMREERELSSTTAQPVDETVEDDEFDPAKHNIDEVLDYVENNPDEATSVYVLEEEGKNRPTLLAKLDEILNEEMNNNEKEQDNG